MQGDIMLSKSFKKYPCRQALYLLPMRVFLKAAYNSRIIFIVVILYLAPCFKLVESVNYQIESPSVSTDLDSISITSSEQVTIDRLIGKRGENIFLKEGVVGMKGFSYMDSQDKPFRVQVDKTELSLNVSDSKNPIAKQSFFMRVLFDTPGQYRLYTAAKNQLLSVGGDKIGFTSCDPTTPCFVNQAHVWKDNAIYGLGYSAQGLGVDQDFEAGSYRPFEIFGQKNRVIEIAKDYHEAQNINVSLSFKANIPSAKAKQSYGTTLMIVATSGY